MKSIIQEGNSIAKAIEQAWTEAGKPTNFSIKILQEAEKNFFGITTKSAKIALLFQEEPQKSVPREQPRQYREQPRMPVQQRRQPERRQQPVVAQPAPQPQPEDQKINRIFWTDEMLATVHGWLTRSLETMNIADVPFATQTNKYILKVVFQKPLHHNSDRERDIFRNFSLLLLQALKHKLKRPLKGFKIVLVRA